MSLSRQVLSSPFDIPAKPRSTHSNNDHNRSVNNIMSDSRVVRRSTLNPSVGKVVDNSLMVQNDCDQCVVLFDPRLMNDRSCIFASPIVVTDDAKLDETNVNAKQMNDATKNKRPKLKPTKVQQSHNIHVQTDDNINAELSRVRVHYSESSAQTDIRCTFDDISDESDSKNEDMPQLVGEFELSLPVENARDLTLEKLDEE